MPTHSLNTSSQADFYLLELIEGLKMFLKNNQRITFLARALGLPWAHTSPLPVCACVCVCVCVSVRAAREAPTCNGLALLWRSK
jgi:hypothetical protein